MRVYRVEWQDAWAGASAGWAVVQEHRGDGGDRRDARTVGRYPTREEAEAAAAAEHERCCNAPASPTTRVPGEAEGRDAEDA